MVRNLLLLYWITFLSSLTFASQQSLSVSGRIIRPDGTALEAASVSFKASIIAHNNSACVLYEETQTKNLSDSDGFFTLSIGESSDIRPYFENDGSGPLNCLNASTYSPTGTVGRSIRIEFDEGQGVQTISPDIEIAATPFAFLANNAKQLGGKAANAYLQVNTASGKSLSQTNLEDVFSTANFTELMALINGTSTRFMTSPSGSSVAISSNRITGLASPSAASDAATKSYVDSLIPSQTGNSGKYLTTDGSSLSWQTVSGGGGSVTSVNSQTGAVVLGADDLTTGTLAYARLPVGTTANTVAAGNDSRIVGALQANGTIGGSTSVNTSGNLVTSGVVSGGEVRATTLKILNGSDAISFVAPTIASALSFTWPNGYGSNGQVLTTNGSGVLSWSSVSSGSATTDAADLTTGTLAYARLPVGTAANTVAAGNDSRIVGALQANGTIGGSTSVNTSGNLVTSGVVSGSEVRATTLKIFNGSDAISFVAPTIASALSFTWPNGYGSNGQVLTTDGSGALSWQTVSGGGGAVSSVNSQTGAVVLDADDLAEGITNKFYTDAKVRATALTGINVLLSGSLIATDTVLTAFGKTQYQINQKASLSGATFTGNVTAPAYYYSSDRKLKTEIKTLSSSLDKVNHLRGVEFKWKDSLEPEVGFIAQEVEAVVPELVVDVKPKDSRDGKPKESFKAVKYGNITALLVEAVKELQQKLFQSEEALKAENEALRARLDNLESEVAELKALIKKQNP